MKRTKLAKLGLMVVGVGVWLAIANPAVAVFTDKIHFQTDTVGSAPSQADYVSAAGGNLVRVVDSSSTPADPFGGPENKSLLLQDTSGTFDAVAGFRHTSPFTTGYASFRIFAVQDATFPTPYFETILFNDGVSVLDGQAQGAEIGPWLSLNATSISSPIAIRVFTSGPTLVLDQTLPANTANRIEIQYNTDSDTFSAKLNGVQLTHGGGATSVFPFYANQTALNAVRFSGGFSTRTGVRVFVDELSVIPEPSTIGLGLVGAALFAWRRRQARQTVARA